MHKVREELASALGNDYRGEVMYDEPMSSHTYLGIGGPADIFVIPADAISLKKCLGFAVQRKMHVLIVGGGTNMLVSDNGFRGMLISLRHFSMKKTINERDDSDDVFIESGVPLQGLLGLCAEKGYAGIESLAGIPGTVGGAIVGNAGAFNQEIKDVITSLVIVNHNGNIKKVERKELSFGYRKLDIAEDVIVLSANMVLGKTDPEVIKRRMKETIEQKKRTQPVFERSAGCAFKNPEGDFAGRLIDAAGCKGMRVGGIAVSTVHSNFLVNKGNGTAAEYIELMNIVKEKVAEHSGIVLEPEIRIVDHVD